MILEAGYEGGAFVRFDDGNDDGRIPTPEVIDDITRRLGRTAAHMNAGDVPNHSDVDTPRD